MRELEPNKEKRLVCPQEMFSPIGGRSTQSRRREQSHFILCHATWLLPGRKHFVCNA